jgi:predicted transcriptional regulator
MSLAIRYGVTEDAIMSANNLMSSDLDICEHQQLIIPTNDYSINRDDMNDQLQKVIVSRVKILHQIERGKVPFVTCEEI